MKNTERILIKTLLLSLLFIGTANAQNQSDNKNTKEAQDGLITVTGVVTDTQGMPVPGANVRIRENKKRKETALTPVQTDFDGFFSIEVKKGSTLEISYIGCDTKEIKVMYPNKYSIKLCDGEGMGEPMVYEWCCRESMRNLGVASRYMLNINH